MEIQAVHDQAISVQSQLDIKSTTTNKVGVEDVRQLLEYIKLIEQSSLKLQE